MKIGIDAHGLGGQSLGAGNEQYSRQLILNLLAIDSTNEYHIFVDEPEELRELADNHPNVRLVGLRPRSQWVQRPLSAPWYAWRNGLDVLHFPFIRPPITHTRTIVTVHDILYESLPHLYTRIERMRMSTLIPWSCRNADLIFTVSEFSRSQIHKHYGIAQERIVVTPNSADHIHTDDQFPMPLDLDGLPEQYVCSIGTLQPRKNLARLVRAFDDLVERLGLPHHLLLVGRQGWQNGELSSALRQLRNPGRIRFTGYASESGMRAILRRAELLVCPSLAEGFAVPPLEAQRLGIPVVVSDTTCFPEVYGSSAQFCNPLNESSISDAIAAVLCDGRRREALIAAGRRNAERYSWRRTAHIALRAYQTLVPNRRVSRMPLAHAGPGE
jgi:glycosyltransferase involved in cell wall biosynthesis